MFEAFRTMLRKRRRTDSGSGGGGGNTAADGYSQNERNASSSSYKTIFDELFNNVNTTTTTASNSTEQQQQFRVQQQQQQQQQNIVSSAYTGVEAYAQANNSTIIEPFEDMEIDPTPFTTTTTTILTDRPTQASQLSTVYETEESYNNPLNPRSSTANKANAFNFNIYTDEENALPSSPMNFDYLQSLHESGVASASATATAPPTSNSARSMSGFSDASAAAGGSSSSSARHYETVSSSTAGCGQQIVDDSRVIDRPFDLNERFVSVLDHLDAHVEKFRKDALGLQEKRDYLLMSIDLIKSNDLLQNMSEPERDEIHTYIQRVNSRLGTVELNVRTVRDTSQEDSLSQINALIDIMITIGDPVMSRQRCQQYLNACCSSAETGGGGSIGDYSEINVFVQESVGAGINMETDIGPVDKKFESVLLGCTLDDQKNIKKRLQALMDYLNKQTISH